jgi:hypothetical protein
MIRMSPSQKEGAAQPVEPAALPLRAKHAQGDADDSGDGQRQACEHQAARELAGDLADCRLAVDDRVAHVAAHHLAEEMPVLIGEAAVEPELLDEDLPLLGSGVRGQQRVHRIAAEAEGHECDRHRAEKHHDQVYELPAGEAKHASHLR